MGCIFQAIKFLHIRWFHRFYTSRKHRGMSYSFFRLNRDWKANAKVYLTWTPCTSFLDYLLFQHLIKKTFLIVHWEIIYLIYALLVFCYLHPQCNLWACGFFLISQAISFFKEFFNFQKKRLQNASSNVNFFGNCSSHHAYWLKAPFKNKLTNFNIRRRVL